MAPAAPRTGTPAPPQDSSAPRETETKIHRRRPTIRLVLAAIVVAALAVAATAFVLRDKIYDPSNSYGTDSPHIPAPAQPVPAKR